MGGLQQHVTGKIGITDNARVPKRLHLYAWCFASLALTSTFAGYETSRFAGASAWSNSGSVEAATLAKPSPRAGNSAAMDFTALAPQDQAQQLLDRAIRRDLRSIDLISKNVDLWRGHLVDEGPLLDAVHNALNADDLRVRAAALEIDLAANNLSKTPETVARLVNKLHDEPSNRPWTLWRLGALGNRGVQPEVVAAQLMIYVHDGNEETRYWAVEGLALLGSDASVNPLLDSFAHDRSARVRQRAACNLAQSGMLTREQRLASVPQLLNFFDDDAMDPATRGWVYGALRMITGVQLGNDANAWRQWWAKRDTTTKHHRRSAMLYA
jgi:hypothetical protein